MNNCESSRRLLHVRSRARWRCRRLRSATGVPARRVDVTARSVNSASGIGLFKSSPCINLTPISKWPPDTKLLRQLLLGCAAQLFGKATNSVLPPARIRCILYPAEVVGVGHYLSCGVQRTLLERFHQVPSKLLGMFDRIAVEAAKTEHSAVPLNR